MVACSNKIKALIAYRIGDAGIEMPDFSKTYHKYA